MGLNDEKLLSYFMKPEGLNLRRILLTKVQRSIFNLRLSPNTYIHMHAVMHALIHTYIYTHIHSYVHIHTYLIGGAENCNLGERGEVTASPFPDKEEA